jgi:hypothetical protein
MTTAVIAGLSAIALYVGKRWLDARTEVAELRTQVAMLKRRLTRTGH